MRRGLAASLVVVFAAGAVAVAGDPPAPAKDAVEIKLAAKAGDAFRFRQTESSSTEVDGKPRNGVELSQDYSVTVKAVRADGGLDVEVAFESIRSKATRPRGSMEFDTEKAPGADANVQTQMLYAVARAMVGAPFTVSLDAQGAPTAVTGLREGVTKGLASTPFAGQMPIDQILDDKSCLKLANEIFSASPAQPRAVGGKWTFDAKDEVSNQVLDFAVEATLESATADAATIGSKLTWKPDDAAKADGAKPEGHGTATSQFSRKDGFPISVRKHLEANRETAAAKATSHSDTTIERLPPKAAGGEKK